jgi:hypothetical protein
VFRDEIDQIHISHLIKFHLYQSYLAINSLNANLIDDLLSSPDFIQICYFCCQQPESEFDSAISSFESQPIKFVSPRSQGKPTSHTIIASHQILANLLRSESTSHRSQS